MTKLLKIFISILSMCTLVIVNNHYVDALSTDKINVYFIVSENKLEKKDELIVNINIDNFDDVDEIKIGINIANNISPMIMSDGYYELSDNSVFTNVLINTLDEEKILKLHVCKETSEALSYQNNIATLKFTCLDNVTDAISLFKDKITLYLFDKENKLLNYDLSFSEKLDASWNILMNELEVNSIVPDYTKSFIVNNRDERDYELIIKQNIDSSVLGMQAITIIVIDKVNKDYLIYNKAINVVDKTIPDITYPDTLTIKDEEINNLLLEKYISINDNYDLKPRIEITYLNSSLEKIETLDEFKKYLKTSKQAYLSFYGIDSSSNTTENIEIEVIITDTTSPVILEKFKDTISINDDVIDNFKIEEYFEISDNYDLSPRFIYTFKNLNKEDEVINIIDALKEGDIIEIEYYGIDDVGNETKKKKTLIKINDITRPVINGLEEITLKDYEVNVNNIIKTIIYSDNLDKKPSLIIEYYTNEEKVNEYQFIENAKKGYSSKVVYKVIDESGNESDQLFQKVTVIDTTAPTISVNHIKNGGKYLKLESIEYEVSDNFNSDIEVYVKLNDNLYENTLISEVGKYKLEIIAKDASGNETIKQIEFYIIENNINGCMGDVDCYIDNYTNVIIATSIMMVGIVAVIIIKVVKSKKKKKKELIINE